jgi:pimeloyl-ACP methyl ester carboxylesterase
MVGTPTESNAKIAKANDEYFQQYASSPRKENDILRKKHYAKIKKPSDSEISLSAYESCSARYWGDFTISHEFLEELWQDVEIDDTICKHFFNNLLPHHVTAKDIDKINVPVILLGGRQDYDCLPLKLWKDYPEPSNFTIIDCGDVGHWPNIEDPEIFDQAIERWLKREIYNNE